MYAARRFVSAVLLPLTDSSSISRASSILAACLIFFCTASEGRKSRPLDFISASAPALWARGICTSENNVTTSESITHDGSSELKVWRGQLLQIHVQLNTEHQDTVYSIDVSVHDLQVLLARKSYVHSVILMIKSEITITLQFVRDSSPCLFQ